MTTHLSVEELVEAAEGGLAAARAAHLDRCAHCQHQAAELGALMRDVASAGDVPEPSPLFWDRMSDRVRLAIAAEPAARSWWNGWRPWAAMATALAALALMLFVRPASPPPADPDIVATADRIQPADVWLPPLEADGPWDLVVGLASELEWEDAQQVAPPRAGTADTLIEELSPAERERLVKLLKSEIGDF
jgi:hypothetical protein